MKIRLSFFVLGLACAAGCGPNPKAPVKVMALVPDQTGNFTTSQVELTTVTDVVGLKGSILHMVGGASIVVDASDPLQNVNGGLQNQTDEQIFAAVVKNSGLDVRANYIDRSGVLWPSDFHTWNMVTTFYNFEHAYNYFVGVYDGVDPAELRNLRVMYWPDVRVNSAIPITDNALYLSLIKSFVVVPQDQWQAVPLAMNIGVIGHEVAHKAFSHKVYKDAAIPAQLLLWNGGPFNLIKSLDEGLADFHAYGVTCLEPANCNPNFLTASVPDAALLKIRNLANPTACMDRTLYLSFLNSSPDQWTGGTNMYKVGDIWAAALYQAANKAGALGAMQKALIRAYDDDNSQTPGLRQLLENSLNTPGVVTPEAVANVILSHITDPQLKRLTCSELLTRVQLTCTAGPPLCAEMPSCPATSARDTATCQTIDKTP